MKDFTTSPVLAAIRQRRSVRAYSGEPVSADDICTILEAGRWAPSGRNLQPWRFLVLRTDDPRKERMREHTKYKHIVTGADTLICVFLDRASKYQEMKDHQGAGACIQTMLLAAHDLGLGAVWLGEIINEPEPVCRTLGVDVAVYELMAVIALGHPKTEGPGNGPGRKDLAELMLEDFPCRS